MKLLQRLKALLLPKSKIVKSVGPIDKLVEHRELFPATFSVLQNAYAGKEELFFLDEISIRATIESLFDNKEQQVAWLSVTRSGNSIDAFKFRVQIVRNTIVPIDHICRRFQRLKDSRPPFMLRMVFVEKYLAKDQEVLSKVVLILNEVQLEAMNFDINTPGLMTCNLYFNSSLCGESTLES